MTANQGNGSNGHAILARGLIKQYKGKRGQPGKEAVRGIDLAIEPGEVFGFLGPNGAGKTTTVRMLCTLLPISGGEAFVDGVNVATNPSEVRQRLGVALQEAGLDSLQSGRELLTLQAGLYRVPRPADRAAELLELVGLTAAADNNIKSYSGGMKRRLDLASALVHRPNVLFLDEPTTGLDPASRQTVWEEVRRINAEGTTVFLTTQYLEEADQLCQRLAIINDGLIVREGSPESLKAALGADVVTIGVGTSEVDAAHEALRGLDGLDHTTVEDDGLALYVKDGAGSVAEIVRRLEGANIRPRTVSVSRPTLDDVFLDVTGHRIEGAERAKSPDTGAENSTTDENG